MRKALLTLALAALAAPAGAQSLRYEGALVEALRVHGCSFGLAEDGERVRFARQVSRSLRVPAIEIADRRSPHYRALQAAIDSLEARGVLAVDRRGATLALADCGD
ncbi:hypothetical protein [Jannaschia sp. W003]|uniref:hypothetical protein n=1 Tax=Jannaschia sp. W003 TaxID=2867012 RepID=UPI0021A7DADB|nr:hypothetical protein [Jannaschia sp. W003]UWQ22830.1 hypothetical protein K3554_07350 [Jannaschia sp. W003]